MLRQAARGSSEAIAVARRFRFSFEAAKNAVVASAHVQTPENVHAYDQYKRANVGSVVEESQAKLIPSVVALHARLALPASVPLSALATSLNAKTGSDYANNEQLAIFGANFLSYYTSEYLLARYPRLPLSVVRAATDAYIGDVSLYDLSKNQWGIQEDTQSKLDRYLNGEPQIFQFGKLQFENEVSVPEKGIKQFKDDDSAAISVYKAHANFARSVISVIYAAEGEEAAKKFIHEHILSRKVDIEKMFQFKESGKLLSILLKSQNLAPFTIKLLSETGRQSNSSVFVVGCYTGDQLLSTAEGTSLKEARVKATTKSLLAWYLYQPLEASSPSENKGAMFVDQGEKFF